MKSLKILFVVTLFCLRTVAQNTPNLSETAPAGIITNPLITLPIQYNVPATPAHNFVRIWIPQKAVQNSNLIDENSLPQYVTQSTNYFDGLGNGIQQIVRYGTSPLYHNVGFSDPRVLGTENYQFLPYAINHLQGSGFRYNMIGEQSVYYDAKFPSEGATAYNKSIVTTTGVGERLAKSMIAGKSQVGQGRGASNETFVQNTGGSIRKWELDINGFPVTNGTYGNGELIYTKTTGEHGLEAYKYSDKEGRTIATKQIADANANITEISYVIYNEIGQPVFTLTPKAVQKIEQNAWVVTQNILDNLCSQIIYDDLGRVISKTVPGKEGVENLVYDKFQRPVLVQDPNLALQNQWLFTIYDDKSRVAFTGILNSTESRQWWQYLMDGSGPVQVNLPTNVELADITKIYPYLLYGHKTIQNAAAYPISITNAEILRFNYYDNYDHTALSTFAFNSNYLNDLYPDPYTIAYAEEPELRTMPTRGLMTGYKEKILKNVGSTSIVKDWVTGIMYYDNKGRIIQAQRQIEKEISGIQVSNVYLDINTTMFDFRDRVVRTVFYHNNKAVSGTPGNYTMTEDLTTIVQKYQYESKTFKLSAVRQKINAQDWMNLSVLNYNSSTGQLNSKYIGGVENQTYAYNIRGQLTGINASYAETGVSVPNVTFGESIKYDFGFNNKRYDGSISGFVWKTPSTKRRAYGFNYTEANRMKDADFRQLDGVDQMVNLNWTTTTIDLSEKDINYDYNGNITHLKRQGPTTVANFDMDNLDYTYGNNDISNRLLKVTDAVNFSPTGLVQDFQNGTSGINNDYTYDKNGNMKTDANKDISEIKYNFLDKPTKVTFIDGTTIEYVYTAGGEKLEEMTSPVGGSPDKTTYTGIAVYQNDVLDNILHSEGKARKVVNAANVASFEYDFFVKDHLGNVRTQVTAEEVSFASYFASHELAAANVENLVFDNIALVNAPRPGANNYDNTKAAKLDASDPDKRIGTAILLHVMAGDKFSVSAEAFYNSDTTGLTGTVSPADMLSSISDVLLANQGGGTNGEGLPVPEVINGAFSSANYVNTFQNILNNLTDPNHPQSYLNYLVFDEQMNLVPSQSGAIQIGAMGTWHTLETLNEIEITQGGYLSVYISNASLAKHTYFDNIMLTYYKGNLKEETHYYPYGMALQVSPAVPTDNKYLYQTKELTRKAGGNDYNIYNFEARQYDPLLGRFTSIDPMGQFASGYVGMGNDPANGIDPDGMLWVNRPVRHTAKAQVYKGFIDNRHVFVNEEVFWFTDDWFWIEGGLPASEGGGSTMDGGGPNGIDGFGSGGGSTGDWKQGQAPGPDHTEELKKRNALQAAYNAAYIKNYKPGPSTDGKDIFYSGSYGESGPLLAFGGNYPSTTKVLDAMNTGMTFVNQNFNPLYMLVNSMQSVYTQRDLITNAPMTGLAPAMQFGGGLLMVAGVRLPVVSSISSIVRVSVSKGVSVIGPRTTYAEFAQKIGANYFKLTKGNAWTWEANVKFLKGIVNRGDDVIFAGRFNPASLDPNSVLAREINYLVENGYYWVEGFSKLIKK